MISFLSLSKEIIWLLKLFDLLCFHCSILKKNVYILKFKKCDYLREAKKKKNCERVFVKVFYWCRRGVKFFFSSFLVLVRDKRKTKERGTIPSALIVV